MKNSEQRILGALIEHKKHTDKRFDRIEREIIQLQKHTWKSLGMRSIFILAVTIIVDIFFHQ